MKNQTDTTKLFQARVIVNGTRQAAALSVVSKNCDSVVRIMVRDLVDIIGDDDFWQVDIVVSASPSQNMQMRPLLFEIEENFNSKERSFEVIGARPVDAVDAGQPSFLAALQ